MLDLLLGLKFMISRRSQYQSLTRHGCSVYCTGRNEHQLDPFLHSIMFSIANNSTYVHRLVELLAMTDKYPGSRFPWNIWLLTLLFRTKHLRSANVRWNHQPHALKRSHNEYPHKQANMHRVVVFHCSCSLLGCIVSCSDNQRDLQAIQLYVCVSALWRLWVAKYLSGRLDWIFSAG